MDWDRVITIVVGLLSGAVGALISPFVNWKIEQIRMKQEYRRRKVAEWRQVLEATATFSEVTHLSVWHELKDRIPEPERKNLFGIWAIQGGGDPEKVKIGVVLQLVARIEKEWNLV